MLDKYRKLHIERIIQATMNLYDQPNSICKKCHDMENICCFFCYCPLYEEDECGGNYKILKNGVKDCSNCTIPHTPEFVREYLTKMYERI